MSGAPPSVLGVMRLIASLRHDDDVWTLAGAGRVRMSAVHKGILFVLALRADNDTGQCWPSIATIAADSGASKTSVKEALRELVDVGLVTKTQRRREGVLEADSNLYALHLGRQPPQVGRQPTDVGRGPPHLGRTSTEGGAADAPRVGRQPPGGRAARDQELLTELPIGTAQGTGEPLALAVQSPESGVTRPKAKVSAADVRRVFDAWLSAREHRGIKGTKPVLDQKRRQVIAARLADGFDVETLKRAAAGIWESDWHLGKNDRGKSFTDIALALRDAEHVERFAAQPASSSSVVVTPRARAESKKREQDRKEYDRKAVPASAKDLFGSIGQPPPPRRDAPATRDMSTPPVGTLKPTPSAQLTPEQLEAEKQRQLEAARLFEAGLVGQ